MKSIGLALLASVAASPLLAQHREVAAHVHGVSELEIAVEHGTIEMNLHSPGADIVGFEYAATSDEDLDAVEAAIRTLLLPENVLTLPEAAECRLAEVLAHLHGPDHEGHADHDGHDEAHEHDDHEEHEEHDHDEHDDHAHDEHEHDDHGEEEHDDHDHGEGHDDHADEHGAHSEFHARYIFNCAHEDELTSIAFPFFETFPNAAEIEAHFVTEHGAGTAEIEAEAPMMELH